MPSPRTRTSRRGLLALGGVASLAAVGTLTGASAPAADPQGYAPSRLGVVGPYSDAQLETLQRNGIHRLLLEVSWSDLQPAEGRWAEERVAELAATADGWREAGFSVALNTGTMDGPAWLLALPGTRWVDQHGVVYDDHPVPNGVFSPVVREFTAGYLAGLFDRLGTSFDLVRAGGSVWGELGYPGQRTADGRWRNAYWCFDAAARRECPVPGYVPGTQDDRAGRFLEWYLDELVGFQDWQVSALREAGVTGRVAMLYPSYGMRPGDAEVAVAGGLAGTSTAEVNGEVQRGFDFARLVAGLRDPGTAVYGTWGENEEVVEYLSGLAADAGRPAMAENAAGSSPAELRSALEAAARLGLDAFYLVRAQDLFSARTGRAGWSDVLAGLEPGGNGTDSRSFGGDE